jgi:hypothetical protein
MAKAKRKTRVPAPRAKTKDELWEEAVREARTYVANYDKARWIIADIALRVCDMSHGGRKAALYSVTNFATDIELNRKTLYEWLRVKRLVYDKLPKGVQTKAHTYDYWSFEEVANQVDEHTSPREVKVLFEQQLQVNPASKKFNKYMKNLKSIMFNATRPLMMQDIDTDTVVKMRDMAKTIVGLLNKELELREKYTGIQLEARRLNIKQEIIDQLEG